MLLAEKPQKTIFNMGTLRPSVRLELGRFSVSFQSGRASVFGSRPTIRDDICRLIVLRTRHFKSLLVSCSSLVDVCALHNKGINSEKLLILFNLALLAVSL